MHKNLQLTLYVIISIVIIAGASIMYVPDNDITGKQFYIFSQAKDIQLLANKEQCFQDSECFSSYCHAGKCTRPYVLFNGEPCSGDKQCRSEFCYNGRCTGQHTVSAEGFSCQSSKECISKACHEGRCISGNFPLGTACTIEDQCISEFCFSGRCSIPWTIYTGGNCIEDKQCQSGICSIGKCQPQLGSEGPVRVRDFRGLPQTGSIFS